MFTEDSNIHIGSSCTIIEGQTILALCHPTGVDIINADIQCTLQTIPIISATMVAFSTHTLEVYLAVYAEGIVHVFHHIRQDIAWAENMSNFSYIKQSEIQISITTFLYNNISFAYPNILTCIGGIGAEITLLSNCSSNTSEIIIGSQGRLEYSQLSYRGRVVAGCYKTNGIIDIFDISPDSKSIWKQSILHADKANNVHILWRPAMSLTQQVFLSYDDCGLVKIWDVLYTYTTAIHILEDGAVEYVEMLTYETTVCVLIIDRFQEDFYQNNYNENYKLTNHINWLMHSSISTGEQQLISNYNKPRDSQYKFSAWLVVVNRENIPIFIQIACTFGQNSKSEYFVQSEAPALAIEDSQRLLAIAVNGKFSNLAEYPDFLTLITITKNKGEDSGSILSRRNICLATAVASRDGDRSSWIVSNKIAFGFDDHSSNNNTDAVAPSPATQAAVTAVVAAPQGGGRSTVVMSSNQLSGLVAVLDSVQGLAALVQAERAGTATSLWTHFSSVAWAATIGLPRSVAYHKYTALDIGKMSLLQLLHHRDHSEQGVVVDYVVCLVQVTDALRVEVYCPLAGDTGWRRAGVEVLQDACSGVILACAEEEVYIVSYGSDGQLRLFLALLSPASFALKLLLNVPLALISGLPYSTQGWFATLSSLQVCLLLPGSCVCVAHLDHDGGNKWQLSRTYHLRLTNSATVAALRPDNERDWVFLTRPSVESLGCLFLAQKQAPTSLLISRLTGALSAAGTGSDNNCFEAEYVQVVRCEEPIQSLSPVNHAVVQVCFQRSWLLLRLESAGGCWFKCATVTLGALDVPTCPRLHTIPVHEVAIAVDLELMSSSSSGAGAGAPSDMDVEESEDTQFHHPLLMALDLLAADRAYAPTGAGGGDADGSEDRQGQGRRQRDTSSPLTCLRSFYERLHDCMLNHSSSSLAVVDSGLLAALSELKQCAQLLVCPRVGDAYQDALTLRRRLSAEYSLQDDALVALCVLASAFVGLFSSAELDTIVTTKNPTELQLPCTLSALDLNAYRAYTVYAAADALAGLGSEVEVKEGRARAQMPGAAVMNALLSGTQRELYACLFSEEFREQNIQADNSQLRFGALWWGRSEAGVHGSGEYDVLSSLSGTMLGMWAVDLEPSLALIERKALAQFKEYRDSMKIFLEMVVVNKVSTLYQLSKTDKNIMGKQLQTLLTNDFASQKGRQAAQKNAFALIRLQRFKDAAATFLCAEPPMLREAARVLSKNLNDPFLAFLVTRVVEARDRDADFGGYVVGPESRRVLRDDMLPGLMRSIRSKTQAEAAFPGIWGVDATMTGLACGMWLQDRAVIRQVLDAAVSVGIFTTQHNCTLVEKVHNYISVAGAVDLLVSSADCTAYHRVGIAHSLQALFSSAHLNDHFGFGLDLLTSGPEPTRADPAHRGNDFMRACCSSLEAWRARRNKKEADEREEREVASALASASLQEGPVDVPVSKGFNFAAMSSAPKHTVAPTAHDPMGAFDIPLAASVSNPKPAPINAAYDPLSDFDIPVQRTTIATVNNTTATAFDPFGAYDVPHIAVTSEGDPKPKLATFTATVYDPLSAFDMPVVNPPPIGKPKVAAFDPFGDFDMPVPRPPSSDT